MQMHTTDSPTNAVQVVSTSTVPERSRRKRSLRALASESGQGTVEYVGLLLLMATVLGGVVAASGALGKEQKIGETVVKQVSNSIDAVGETKVKK